MRRNDLQTDAYGRVTSKQDAETGDIRTISQRHKRFYDAFFSGYSVRSEYLDDGTVKAVREYTGTLHRQELDFKQMFGIRICYAGLFLLAAFLLGAALVMNVDSNKCPYVMVAGTAVIICYGRLLFSAITYITSGQHMKDYEYKSGARMLPKWSRLAGYAVAVLIGSTVVMFFLSSGTLCGLELCRIVMLFCSGAMIWVIGEIEKRIPYTQLEAKAAHQTIT